MLVKDAAIRSMKEIFLMFYFLLTKPRQIEARIGLFKTVFSFLISCFLIYSVLISPLIDSVFLRTSEKTIYLNILEPPQHARNTSYLCEFKLNSLDKSILSYDQSHDFRRISISTGDGDFKKKNCKEYFPGYLFNDYDVKGTIINIFYSGNIGTTLNATADFKEIITLSSDLPMKMFIRNKKAILIQHSPYTGILTRGIVHLDHSVKEAFSWENNFLNYSRHFVFKDAERYGGLTIYNPRVSAYTLPTLNEMDITSMASFRHDPKFTVNLHMPQKRFGEGIQSFFKIQGRINSKDPYRLGSSHFDVAAYDFIDTNNLSYFSKYWNYGKPFVYALSSLFVFFFLINLYSLKTGKKLADVTYRKPHVDDVIRQAAKPQTFGFGTKRD